MIRVNKPYLVAIFIVLMLMTIVASLTLGARHVEISKAIHALTTNSDISMDALVVRQRIPRTVFGLIAGAALGVSGAVMQSLTRNPIADPSILGVNTGASLFVVSGMAFLNFSSASQMIGMALLGAALTFLLVYTIGSMGAGGATPIKLALAGAATSAALSSLVSAVLLPRTEVMNAFRFWQVGSISGASWDGILSVVPFIGLGMFLALLVAPSLNALALGEEVATGLGVNIGVIRFIGSFSSILLCGATTALAGPIGFVGLMVPHTVRLLFGSNISMSLPLSAFGGAVVLVLADVMGRLMGSPGELEAGIVTAFIGAPILIIIAMKVKGRGL